MKLSFLENLSVKKKMFAFLNSIFGVKEDITKLKKVEELLRESEERMKKLAEAVFDPIIMMDNDEKISYWNNAAENIFGYTADEVIGKEMHSLLAPSKYLQSYRKGFENFRTVGQGSVVNKTVELEALRKDGTEFPIELSVSAFQLNGKWNAIGILKDITKQKLMEKALLENEERFKLLFETSQEGIVAVLGGKLSYYNPAMVEITGYKVQELFDLNLVEIIYHEDRDLVVTNYEKHLAGENIEQRYQFRILRKDNSLRWVEVSGVKLEWRGQSAILNLMKDITDQKIAEIELCKLNEELEMSRNMIEENLFQKNMMVEELTETKDKLEKLNSEKDKFFSIIAHDLKSPFVGIIGFAEIIADEENELTKDELMYMNKGIYKSAKNLSKLLQNLLDWSQMQQGTVSFEPVKINLAQIVKDNVNIIKQRCEQKGITIKIDIDETLVVHADQNMLNSVLRNLLSNAVKFTEKDGRITIKAKENSKDKVEIAVSDTGVGMPEELRKKLFKIEEKVGRKGTKGEESTGLGLLLCKEFIEKHGGSIWVESQEETGSTFYFTLPN